MKLWKSATWLALLLAIAIGLGVGFRFTNLGGKVYWFDEVYTSFRAAGYTSRGIDQAIFQNRILSAADLQQFQQIKPDSQVSDTLNSLITEDPQHPPLYFVTARWWMQIFGSSLTASRSLPALISLFALPVVYRLSMELFRSRLAATLAVVLLAVSPFDILFAQTARQYSLLTLAVVASSWLLLRSLRCQTRWSWAGYALSLAVGFYSHPLFVLTLVAQGIYVLLWSRWQQVEHPTVQPEGETNRAIGSLRWLRHWLDWRTIGNASLAMILCGLLYSPWIYVLFSNYQRASATTSWTKSQVGFFNLLKLWVLSFTSLFVDINASADDPMNYLLRLPVLVLIGVAFYVLVRYTSRQSWMFVVLLVLVPFLLLALPDLVLGGKRSAVSRYLIPCFPGVQLAVAYLMARLLQRGHWLGRSICALVVIGAIASVTASSFAPTWWSKSMSYANGDVADYINAAPAPLVISDRGDNYTNKGQLISISYQLRDNTQLLLFSHPPDLSALPLTAKPLVYQPSNLLRESLEAEGWQLELVFPPGGLWQAQYASSTHSDSGG